MSLRLLEESQLTKSALGFSKNQKDPAFQTWINKGGPGLSSQSQQFKSAKKLPPHPDFTLKGTAPVKKVHYIVVETCKLAIQPINMINCGCFAV